MVNIKKGLVKRAIRDKVYFRKVYDEIKNDPAVRPDGRKPDHLSIIYRDLATAKRYVKEGDLSQAGAYYHIVGRRLNKMLDRRNLNSEQITQVKNLQELLYLASDGKYGIRPHRPLLPSVIAIAGLLAGIFFLSANITGNAIADLTIKTTSFLGAGLLIVGLIAGFFWLKSR